MEPNQTEQGNSLNCGPYKRQQREEIASGRWPSRILQWKGRGKEGVSGLRKKKDLR